jgi:thiosulfate/3-mercaptopyruvate sulfurtransferase
VLPGHEGGAIAAPGQRIAGPLAGRVRSGVRGPGARVRSPVDPVRSVRPLHSLLMSLISTDELLARLGDPSLRIADVRWWLTDPDKGRRDYMAAHLPGAVFVDVDRDLVAPAGPGRHPLPEPAAFAARMAALGFGDDHEIVVYDDAGGTIAARLWWMLDDLGHPRTRLLDGGLAAWTAIGGPLTDLVPSPAPATLTLRPAWNRRVEQAVLVETLGSVALLDARAPERYRGDVEPVDPVAGHIPTARNLPTGRLLGGDGSF